MPPIGFGDFFALLNAGAVIAVFIHKHAIVAVGSSLSGRETALGLLRLSSNSQLGKRLAEGMVRLGFNRGHQKLCQIVDVDGSLLRRNELYANVIKAVQKTNGFGWSESGESTLMADQNEIEIVRRFRGLNHAYKIVAVDVMARYSIINIPSDNFVAMLRRIGENFFSLDLDRVGLFVVSASTEIPSSLLHRTSFLREDSLDCPVLAPMIKEGV